MPWTWRYEKTDGAAVSSVDLPEATFASQGDAESWLGENWRGLLDAGGAALAFMAGVLARVAQGVGHELGHDDLGVVDERVQAPAGQGGPGEAARVPGRLGAGGEGQRHHRRGVPPVRWHPDHARAVRRELPWLGAVQHLVRHGPNPGTRW